MLNRQPLPPLYIAAGLTGPVARPINPLGSRTGRGRSATNQGHGPDGHLADDANLAEAHPAPEALASAVETPAVKPFPMPPVVDGKDAVNGRGRGDCGDGNGNGDGRGPRDEDGEPASAQASSAQSADETANETATETATETAEPELDADRLAAAGRLPAAGDGRASAEGADLAVPPTPDPETVDLSGYGAYGNVPAAGTGLSRDELVARYAHLVKYVVGRLGVSVPGLFDHEDAMQAGVLGLLRAIDAYRPDAAASFESYAILRIRGSILDAVRSLDNVGRAGREAARAIQGAIRELQHELGRSPTESEIAARLDMPVARYRERLQAASVVTVSLDERDSHDSDDESIVLAENAPDPNAVDPADEAARRDAIASLIQEIGRLGERARLVLALYYQDEMTFKEIGQVLGVTESRVCQIHTEAVLALRLRLVDGDLAARLGRRRARA
jgi:RNA polymerase sigma factor for flagellar operon FliA